MTDSGAASEPPAGEQIDRFGAVTSSLCAVHCALGAVLPAALGALGAGFLFGHEAEWVFTLLAVSLAAGALALGWRRHRSVLVAGMLGVGIVGLLASRGLESSEGPQDHDDATQHSAAEAEEHGTHLVATGVGVLAGLTLLGGHVLNIRASRRRIECLSHARARTP